ncbi:MAG: hypothetical protein LBQ86_00630 [Holophagales bacterium]|nr:hypothetical protein [Holophagales bacterium]
MTMTASNACPSCRHKLSPLTIECPVCGIPISRPPLKRPLLFQVSKDAEAPQQRGHGTPKILSAPALGRIAPVDLSGGTHNLSGPDAGNQDYYRDNSGVASAAAAEPEQADGQSIFWRLALMECQEAVSLLVLNCLIVFTVCWQLNLPPGRAYGDFWPYLITLHFLVSWAYFMLPMLLTGSSAAMLRMGFGIADSQPEKRLSFSLFMLLSVAFLPLSFLCMVLTPAHTTLAEILTGQEIRERTRDLVRRR